MIYLPKGLAHGFYASKEPVTLVCNVSYVCEADAFVGVRWDTVGAHWPIQSPFLSNRGRTFLALDEFKSPFCFSENVL